MNKGATCEFWGFHGSGVSSGDLLGCDLWNVGILPQNYTTSQLRRPPLEIPNGYS